MITKETLKTINKFNEAFNNHDVDQIMSLMTEDCIFENTRPSPDGERFEGQTAVRKVWEEMFIRSPKANFDTEEIFAFGDRCIVRWIYHWIKEGKEGHVRGVDIIRVREGKITEKFSYVKG
jgi:ketosteroid isomerase-like protein